MQSGVNADKLAPVARQRSVSNAAEASSSGAAYGTSPGSPGSDLHRSHSTGKKFGDGLKRRFGSLRRRKSPPEE